ncbi:MAG TPA: hypothetical protein VGQ71_13245 [Terriglobales bacterium]|nr:hypothetical protein [Terriglobales bacterium]
MSDDYRLLITGSRQASDAMLAYAEKAVIRAADLGWRIIVGDAMGVDLQVVITCHKKLIDFDCFGIADSPRNVDELFRRRMMLPRLENRMTYHQVKGDYLARDRHMATLCSRVLAIWNCQSRGTLYTYNQVRNLGKPGDLIRFKD